MRLALAIATASLLTTLPVLAQSIDGYGVRTGVNTSNMSFDIGSDGDATALERETGFQIAAFVEVGTPLPFLSALVEAEYARRSYRWLSLGTTGDQVVEAIEYPSSTLHYASVPMLAKLQTAGTGLVVPYAVVGPRLDVLMGSSAGTITREVEGATRPLEFRDELVDAIDTIALSGVVGGGVGLRGLIGSEIRVEARYGFGLTNLVDSDFIDWRSRGLDFSVALAF